MIVIKKWVTERKARPNEIGLWCEIVWQGAFLFGVIPLYLRQISVGYSYGNRAAQRTF